MSPSPDERFVVAPGVVVKRSDDGVYVANEIVGIGLKCSTGVLAALELLRAPVALGALAQQNGLSVKATFDILDPLIRSLIIVPQDFAPALSVAPIRQPSKIIGQFLAMHEIAKQGVAGAMTILGAPTNVAAGPEGNTSHGPHLVRQAFPDFLPAPYDQSLQGEQWASLQKGIGVVLDLDFRRQYPAAGLPRVFDVGDVTYQTGEGIEQYGKRLSFVVDRIVDAGMRPITIGGDHSITRYTVGSLLQRHTDFGIIHFDAHHDLYQGVPPKTLSHANPFSFLIREEGVRSLLQVGLRTRFEPIERKGRPVREERLRYISAFECQSMSPESIFHSLSREVPYYLSFDIDVVDPMYAPETGTPELGGLTYYQCMNLVDYAARHFDLIGADIVEVSGSERRINMAARIAARIVAQILVAQATFEPLETYLFDFS